MIHWPICLLLRIAIAQCCLPPRLVIGSLSRWLCRLRLSCCLGCGSCRRGLILPWRCCRAWQPWQLAVAKVGCLSHTGCILGQQQPPHQPGRPPLGMRLRLGTLPRKGARRLLQLRLAGCCLLRLRGGVRAQQPQQGQLAPRQLCGGGLPLQRE